MRVPLQLETKTIMATSDTTHSVILYSADRSLSVTVALLSSSMVKKASSFTTTFEDVSSEVELLGAYMKVIADSIPDNGEVLVDADDGREDFFTQVRRGI